MGEARCRALTHGLQVHIQAQLNLVEMGEARCRALTHTRCYYDLELPLLW